MTLVNFYSILHSLSSLCVSQDMSGVLDCKFHLNFKYIQSRFIKKIYKKKLFSVIQNSCNDSHALASSSKKKSTIFMRIII